MKATQNNQNYISTSQAARMLGLSVGTVQRMVENGAFKAFITHGGHRRILSSSLHDYCQQHGLSPNLPARMEKRPQVCILHDVEHMSPAIQRLGELSCVTVMTHPLDLMDIGQDLAVLFVDARIAWLQASPVHLQNARLQDAHIVLYNSDGLPSNSPFLEARHLQLFPGDISTDLVEGYLLSLRHLQPQAALHH
jgi:excisionase family DNA binding protein